MQIPTYPLSPTMQRIAASLATRPAVATDVLRRADMPKSFEEQVAKNLNVPPILLLTKDDIAFIKKATGVEIDYDTGKSTGTVDPAAGDFIEAIVDARYEDFARGEPSKELTATDVREIFKNRAAANKPLDPNILTEVLKWFDEMAKSSNGPASPSDKTVGVTLDQYA